MQKINCPCKNKMLFIYLFVLKVCMREARQLIPIKIKLLDLDSVLGEGVVFYFASGFSF